MQICKPMEIMYEIFISHQIVHWMWDREDRHREKGHGPSTQATTHTTMVPEYLGARYLIIYTGLLSFLVKV